jgi:hypothetical protein
MPAFEPGRIQTPVLIRLYEYWAAKRRPDGLPTRRDIDPLDIPQLLPYLYLLEVEPGTERLRFRLVGTQVVEWFGRDSTRLYMDQPEYGPDGPALIAEYRTIITQRSPHLDHRHRPHLDRLYRNYERLVLPLAGVDQAVAMLLCGVHIQPTLPG